MPTPTRKQKQAFAEIAFEDSLEWATDWIQDNMTPDEVFGVNELKDWVQNNKNPEEIFEEDQLAKWAKDNGYVIE